MRTITRNPNPPACLAQQSAGQRWDGFKDNCHQQVGNSLRAEQHHVCCYCEVEITENNSHIEHMAPRSVRPDRVYDYNNLAASCDGGLAEHCGHFKDNRSRNPNYRYDPDVFCSPHMPGTAALLQYLPTGSVIPTPGLNEDDRQKADYMIGYLGLNCARLTGRRRAHARQLIATLGPCPDPELVQWAIGYYVNPDPQNKLLQFTSLSKKMLNQ